MPKLAKYVIWICIAAVVAFLLWYFSNIVAYILISAVLAITGKPLVDRLMRIRIGTRRFPKWLAALVTLVTIWLVAVLFISFFIPLVLGKVGELSRLDIPHIIESFRGPIQSVQDWITNFFSLSEGSFSLQKEISAYLSDMFSLNTVNNLVSGVVSAIGSTVVALFSITFITFFFLKEDKLFQSMIVALFPKRYEENIEHAINSATKLLIRYFTGILAESSIIFILLSVAFLLWGFTPQTAFFMGFMMAVLNVVPYIGPLIGLAICVTVGMITPMEGWSAVQMAMIVVGMVAVTKGLDDFVLQPALYSNRVRAHPLEIFLVILIAGSLAGVVGMLLAIPAYTVLRVFAKEFFNNYRLVQELTGRMDT
ncbi:AI-2E family transporter [Alistipes sp. OttesenSCG-928-B03]|nr:AI-2E family transporter [Alistipes sp. OttesenSCG-928-B03]